MAIHIFEPIPKYKLRFVERAKARNKKKDAINVNLKDLEIQAKKCDGEVRECYGCGKPFLCQPDITGVCRRQNCSKRCKQKTYSGKGVKKPISAHQYTKNVSRPVFLVEMNLSFTSIKMAAKCLGTSRMRIYYCLSSGKPFMGSTVVEYDHTKHPMPRHRQYWLDHPSTRRPVR